MRIFLPGKPVACWSSAKVLSGYLNLIVVLSPLILSPLAGAEAAESETLIAPPLSGFRLGGSGATGGDEISQYVPQSETLDNWTRRVVIEIDRSNSGTDPDAYARKLANQWQQTCPAGDAQNIKSGRENGYPFAVWMFICPVSPLTAKPEEMWLKAISGRDALYAVQYADRLGLSRKRLRPALGYLRQIILCDPRSAGHPCPPQGQADGAR